MDARRCVLRLVFRAQEVEHGFDRVEGAERHFHEHCVPVSHGAVPQAWKLKGFQWAPFMGLVGDEISIRVPERLKSERLPLVITHATDDIYWIKVGGGIQNGPLLVRRDVNLRLLHDL